MPAIVFRLLVSLAAATLACRAHHRSNALLEEQQMLRWDRKTDELPNIFSGEEERNNRLMEDSDASISSDEILDLSKRRDPQSRGPTLSVVSPLEVLRQRLRLDRAKQLFQENQRQIVANEALLEKIGKRGLLLRP